MTAICSHDWPGDLDREARCTLCGLEYGDWSADDSSVSEPTHRTDGGAA